MTSQSGTQTVTKIILSGISKTKGNRTMKFGHLIQHDVKKIFFFKNHAENEAERLVPGLFFSKKLYTKLRQVVRTSVSKCFCSPRFEHTLKTNCMKLQTVDADIC